MGAIVTLRDTLYAAIVAERDSVSTSYPLIDFTVEKTHLPNHLITAIPTGVCSVLGLANDYGRNKARCNLIDRITPIHVCIKKPCNYTDVPSLDTLVNLVQAIEETVIGATVPEAYQFIKLESMKDAENGTPYAYAALRESATFEAYFTVFYQTHLQF